MKQHLAIFGNVQIPRVLCNCGQRWAMVVDGERQCCGRAVDVTTTKVVRVSQPEARRRKPGVAHQREILKAQHHRCLYCDVSLDGYVTYREQIRKVKLTWDHMAPYKYTLNNRHENFAATCQFCNAWKSSRIFSTVDEVRLYVATKWEREGRDTQPKKLPRTIVSKQVQAEAVVAEVLLPTLSVPSVGSQEPTPDETKTTRPKGGIAVKYLGQIKSLTVFTHNSIWEEREAQRNTQEG